MTLLQKFFALLLLAGFISCGPSDGQVGEVDMNDDTKQMSTPGIPNGESDIVEANTTMGKTEASRVGQRTDDNDGKLNVDLDYSFDNNYGEYDDSYTTRGEVLADLREKGILPDDEIDIPTSLTDEEDDGSGFKVKYVSMGEAYRQRGYAREGNVLENDNDIIYDDKYDAKIAPVSGDDPTVEDIKTKEERLRDNSPDKKADYQDLNKELINPVNQKDN